MRCYACGDQIEFWGERCPICGVDKTPMHGTRLIGLGFVLIGFVVGGLRMGWQGAIGAGILGGIIWACIEVVWNRLAKDRKRKAK